MSNKQQAAADFVQAIRIIAEKPKNMDNLESYLAQHFDTWLRMYANTPENMAAEMKEFASMII